MSTPPTTAPACPDTDGLTGTPDGGDLVEAKEQARVKVVSPNGALARTVLPHLSVGDRVILPATAKFEDTVTDLTSRGVHVRQTPYWVEEEHVPAGSAFAAPSLSPLGKSKATTTDKITNPVQVQAAVDAFDTTWELLNPDADHAPDPTPVSTLIPAPWARYLPFDTFNPAQTEAIPHLTGTTDQAPAGHVVVVAPTGAGKTVVGMVACLSGLFHPDGSRTGKKAAWLVPQRSLTSELADTLRPWTNLGLRIQALSGETATDLAATRDADVWVSTTEKFEALARSSSMREAMEQVSVLVVDEIHLLGEAGRGPVLEALLARIRHVTTPATPDQAVTGDQAGATSPVDTRVVGLSATVTNAEEVAAWLGATLIRVAWRPTRLVTQIPLLPPGLDRIREEGARTDAAADLTGQVTRDGGSVLVFCGSKTKVRKTAVEIARQRGADTQFVDVNDPDQVESVCTPVGVGLHYSDWPHKRPAEAGFRSRKLDVLVATTTVAAGVNLPARAVIVRDTTIGLGETMSTASIQQMFGRAGRVGHGETEGYAYLLTTPEERPGWVAKLNAGNTVRSRIGSAIEDHLLAEIIQGRVSTTTAAEHWWVSTFAYHQGTQSTRPVTLALERLTTAGMITTIDGVVAPTDLGLLTSRMMIPFRDATLLRDELRKSPVPDSATDAEWTLVKILAEKVETFAGLPVPEASRDQVGRIVGAGGDLSKIAREKKKETRRGMLTGAHLTQAALLLVTRSPHVFTNRSRVVAGVPFMLFFPVLAEAPRYLSWLAAQGPLGVIHPWVAVVAGDVGRRTRWYSLGTSRGSGRLLWMLEQMTGARTATENVPPMWGAATSNGVTSPDWQGTTPPRGCVLRQDRYEALLSERAGNIANVGTLTVPAGGAVAEWVGSSTDVTWHREPGQVVTLAPAATGALFSGRGDQGVTDGWLLTYRACATPQARTA